MLPAIQPQEEALADALSGGSAAGVAGAGAGAACGAAGSAGADCDAGDWGAGIGVPETGVLAIAGPKAGTRGCGFRARGRELWV